MGTRARDAALGAEFQALYREHFAFVWRMLVRFGVHAAELEDGAQDVFLVVHRRLADWPSVSPRAWLYGIARRVAADRHRAAHRHRRKLDALEASPAPAASAASVEQRFAHREQLSALGRILARLDPKLREVFVLADIEGMTAREMSAALEINPNTASARLRRARSAVDRAMDHLAPPSTAARNRSPRRG